MKRTTKFFCLFAILAITGGFFAASAETAHSQDQPVPGHSQFSVDDPLTSKVTLSGGITENHLRTGQKPRGTRRLKESGGAEKEPHSVSPDTAGKINNTITAKTSGQKGARKKFSVTQTQKESLNSLINANSSGVQIYFNRKNGTPCFIKTGKINQTASARKALNMPLSRKAANKFMADNRTLLKLSDPSEEMVIKKEWADNMGSKHFRYQQTHKGVPLWGRETVLHLNTDDSVYLFQGRYEPGTDEQIQTEPGITAEEALEAAKAHMGITGDLLEPPETELVIYTADDGKKTLAYKTDIFADITHRWLCFTDAETGEFLHSITGVYNDIVEVSGYDIDSRLRDFNVWYQNGTYYLVDPSVPDDDPPYSPVPDIKSLGNTYILTANNTESDVYFITGNSSSAWDPAGVSAAYNIRTVHDYYRNLGRNGIDNRNSNYIAIIHISEDYANAFWNGKIVGFGDGDNQTFSSLAASLDITAHEIQHGITQFTAGLIYENQSGALNEAFSDIFACMVDRDDWTVGEGVTLKGQGYLRNLANPELGFPALGKPLPSKMSEYRNLPNTKSGDYGGVHINMSIPSRAAYLMAEGLTAEGTGTSIGREKTEKIFYRALTTYLQASSQFLDARRATIQAAEDIYPSDQTVVGAVQSAWDIVEVIDENIGAPDDQKPTPTDTVAGNDMMVYLRHVRADKYDLYVQYIPYPFTGYNPNMDSSDLNLEYVTYTRPAVYTNSYGTLIFYVGIDNNLYAVLPDGTGHEQITDSRDIWSFAISPDGNYFAYTVKSEEDKNIYVGNLETKVVTPYPVEPPSDLPPGSEGVMNTILYADALAFDYSSKIIVFDALNCLSTSEAPCGSEDGGYRYYSIGFLDISDGSFEFPFPNQNPDYDIAYPSFAYNNNYVIGLDMVDYSEYVATGVVYSGVWTMNWQNQTTTGIADPNSSSNDQKMVYGMPSFWGGDDYITMVSEYDDGRYAFRIPIDESWKGDVNGAEPLNDFEVDLPVMHRIGVRNLSAEIQTNYSSLSFDAVSIGETSSQELTLTNTGNRDIDISNIEIQGSSDFGHNGVNTLLPRGKSMNIRVTFSPAQAAGTVAATLTITSDADVPQTNISLTGTGTGDRVKINGWIMYNGTPLCAMVLANGQYVFSCTETGKYEMTVSLNNDGMIVLFGFVDGLAPFSQELTPQQATDYVINMQSASDSNPVMYISVSYGISSTPGMEKISGQVLYNNGTPLCAMVLANGSHVFSCGGNGEYELDVPLSTDGKITLFGFVDGFKPYKVTLTPP